VEAPAQEVAEHRAPAEADDEPDLRRTRSREQEDARREDEPPSKVVQAFRPRSQ
jgi:hypothetical protein